MRLVMKLSERAIEGSISSEYERNTRANRFGPRELTDPWAVRYDSDYY
jgi:hypothetical protein